ncbi:interleukin 21 receptor, tandem duplicate 2 isoform X2 [Betta splendens]|uniref:Interleukin 21 receptor, tandem duplicate 2 isoform X2 n=1 Tax=Betta splendens TaxID=158456 RepID=A0A9W2XBX6_BETSP|nr:interleukin 21 receptor, tandem duplicate 2 isoform X2 [Betta splendens]
MRPELCSAPDSCQLLEKWFSPIQHIRLTVPYDVKVQQTPEVFNFTWKSGYEDHPYFSKQFHYEILLEAAKSKESEPFNRTFQETNKKEFLSVSRSSLKSHNRYCIKVRSYSSYIGGIWSEWSKWTCWENDEEPGSEKTPVIVTKVLAPVCVLFAVLLFLFYSPAARMKIKTLSHTPSPAPFFQPLFQQYEGNLQDWLSSKSKCTIIYKNEETLMTDAVTVEPKPRKKELEENLGLHEAPVMLPVAQTQTSYVGLPGRHQASSPVTVLCPGDSSYTQLPCSIWGFSLGGVQVEPPPAKASSEISCSDSGCSFDSLSESPDCSLPTSPAVDASPPFHCSDYCILNKTAEGVVPVLVTMGRSPRDAADPPRDEDHT